MNKSTLTKEKVLRLCVLLAVPLAVAAVAHLCKPLAHFTCPIRAHMGFLCPGCGMSRAVDALWHFRVLESIRFNPAALLLAVLGIGFYCEQWVMLLCKRRFMPRGKWFYIIAAAVFCLYCIVRNLPACAFLSIA